MNPWPGPRSVLLVDNCRIHSVKELVSRVGSIGAKVIFLEPYDPQHMPIEVGFRALKRCAQQRGPPAPARQLPLPRHPRFARSAPAPAGGSESTVCSWEVAPSMNRCTSLQSASPPSRRTRPLQRRASDHHVGHGASRARRTPHGPRPPAPRGPSGCKITPVFTRPPTECWDYLAEVAKRALAAEEEVERAACAAALYIGTTPGRGWV